jgi:hypothetical protein
MSMKTKIFISHSGEMAFMIGQSIKDMLEAFFPNKVNVVNLRVGNNWFDQIVGALLDTEIFVSIVDRKFRESTWCAFEMGFYYSLSFHDRDSNIHRKVIAIEIEKDIVDPRKKDRDSPHAHWQPQKFSKEIIFELIQEVQLLHPSNFSMRVLLELFENVDGWMRLAKDIEKTVGYFAGDGGRILFEGALNIDNIERARYIKDELAETIKFELSKCLDEAFYFKEQGNPLSNVFVSLPLRLMDNLGKTLRSAAGGRLSITDQRFFETMWKDEIIGNVENYIWTTNTRGSFARRPDQRYLMTQKELLSKRIHIERVFIIGTNETDDELVDLVLVMAQQMEIGVRVRFIMEDVFRTEYEDKLNASVGGIDFMVLDNSYVYLTNSDRHKNLVLGASLANDNRVMPAIDMAKSITDNRSTKSFARVAEIFNYFKMEYPRLAARLATAVPSSDST